MQQVDRFVRAAAIAALVAVAAVPALWATTQGRVHGTVTDETGKPVADVRVIVTLEGNNSFRVEDTTNNKGAYAVTLIDATRVYSYRWEKEGYQALEQSFKVAIGQNEKHDVQILTNEEAMRRGTGGSAPTAADQAVEAFNAGAEASQQGDTVTARAKFEEAAALDPTLSAPWTALATLAYSDEDWARAAEMADKAHSLDPADAKPLRILISAHRELGNEARAQEFADKLTAVDPKAGAEALYSEGVQLFNAGDTEGAARKFAELVAASPQHARGHYMLGTCLVGSDPAKAREHLETFLSLAPGDADAAVAQEMLQYLK